MFSVSKFLKSFHFSWRIPPKTSRKPASLTGQLFLASTSHPMSASKLKIAVFSSKSYDQQFITESNKNQHEITFLSTKLNIQTVPLTKGLDAICIFVNDICDKAVLQKLSENGVKLILLRCAGFNNVDLLEAKRLGIKVYRVPAYSPYAVAEHAVALLLTLNRKVHKAYQRVREQNFALEGLLGFDIRGKAVGVLGTGKIGAVFAEIMKGFGCKLIGYDVFQNADLVKATGLQYVTAEELFQQSDIISIHLPLLPTTHHMLNAEAFAKMKDGVYVINTSRGGIIDSKAAIQSLKSGKIGGLGLDVYEEESEIFFEDLSGQILQDDVFARLLTFPNVIVTGHQAFFTKEAWQNIAGTTCQNVDDYLNHRDTNEMTKTVKAEEITNDQEKPHKVVSVDEKAVNKLRLSITNLRASQEKKQ